MTSTVRRITLVLAAFTAAGCLRAVPVTATPTPAVDYRTLAKADLEALIKSKIGVDDVQLTAKGNNVYSGTLQHIDGTILPVEVTVEAQRIICATNTPAGSTRQIITPQGVNSDLNIK